jgi:hypothetical protein
MGELESYNSLNGMKDPTGEICQSTVDKITSHMEVNVNPMLLEDPEENLETILDYVQSIEYTFDKPNPTVYVPNWGHIDISKPDLNEEGSPENVLSSLLITESILNLDIIYLEGSSLDMRSTEWEQDTPDLLPEQEQSVKVKDLIKDIHPGLSRAIEEIHNKLTFAIENPVEFKMKLGEKGHRSSDTLRELMTIKIPNSVVLMTLLISSIRPTLVNAESVGSDGTEEGPISQNYTPIDEEDSFRGDFYPPEYLRLTEIEPCSIDLSQIETEDTTIEEEQDMLEEEEAVKEEYQTLAEASYIFEEERVTDPKLIANMELASALVNEYFEKNSLKAIPINPQMSLSEFMDWVTQPDNPMRERGFRYLEAMNYFRDEGVWVQPRQGIEGGGACDVATLIRRSIIENYEKYGRTENWFGHKVERWGPFVIVYYDHTPYPGMAEDMIAVSSLTGSEDYKDSTNTEMFVFLVYDGIVDLDGDFIRIDINMEEDGFNATLISDRSTNSTGRFSLD